jgi:hypothetical protein
MTETIDSIIVIDSRGDSTTAEIAETPEKIGTIENKKIIENNNANAIDTVELKPTADTEIKSTIEPNELNMSVGMESTANVFHCKAQISMDKILIITIVTAAFLIKCIMDFPEFLIMLLIIVMIGSGGALYYLYPQQVTRILEKGMFMHILCASMLTSTPAITGLCC